MTDGAWEVRYQRYIRDCAGWGIRPQPFEDWKRYWETFAKDGELLANCT